MSELNYELECEITCVCGEVVTVTEFHPGTCTNCGARLRIVPNPDQTYTPWCDMRDASKQVLDMPEAIGARWKERK